MIRRYGLAAIAATLTITTPAFAQTADRAEGAARAAVVIALPAPSADEVSSDSRPRNLTVYQKGNRRNADERGSDAKMFCQRINYRSGLVLEYGTISSPVASYDYLKRVICFD